MRVAFINSNANILILLKGVRIMRKFIIIAIIAVCGVVMATANTAKATPLPWLDFGQSFLWDTSGGGSLYTDQSTAVNSLTYSDGSIYDLINYFAEGSGPFSEPIFGAIAHLNISFDGDNTNDTVGVVGWFDADITILDPTFDPVNMAPNPFVAMLNFTSFDVDGPSGASSQWMNEFAPLFPNASGFDAQLRLSFNSASNTNTLNSDIWQINGTGKVAPVPEPGTIALLGIGLAGLVGVGMRKRAKKKAA